MALIRVPFTFNQGAVTFQDYNTVKNRINTFSNVSLIGNGKDQSNTYDMNMITLGKTTTAPTILVQSCMHPPEWQGLQYALKFFEMIRDDTFPDKVFRNQLTSFRVLYIPVVNPWGLANLDDPLAHTSIYRRNVKRVDLNDDFNDFTQQESKNVKAVMDTYKPFSFCDLHMCVYDYPDRGGKNLILGNGRDDTDALRIKLAQSWAMNSGQPVHEWDGSIMAEDSGLARKYASKISTPYATYPLAYITEMVRPSTEFPNTPLNNEQIMEYGLSSLYLFFKTSMDYYYKRAQ